MRASRRLFIGIGSLTFFLLMFAIFFYLQFPFNLLELRQVALMETQSGCHIDVKKRERSFPLRFVWHDMGWTCPNFPLLDGHIASMEVEMEPIPLILHRSRVAHFTLGVAGGKISGIWVAQPTGARSPKDPLEYQLTYKGTKLSVVESGLTGQVDLEGHARWGSDSILQGEGTLFLRMKKIEIKEIVAFPTLVLSLSEGQAKMDWRGGAVSVRTLSLKGDEGNLHDVEGTLQMAVPLTESKLALTGDLVPGKNLKMMAALFLPGSADAGTWKVALKGTLANRQLTVHGTEIKF